MKKLIGINEGWQFRETGTSEWLPARVPGCVQLDLMSLGMLDDPYSGNEQATHEIEGKGWEYRGSAAITEPPDQYDSAALIFKGLDTYAQIYLNGAFLGETQNALIPHRLECKANLITGVNLLEVRFASTRERTASLHREDGRDLGYVCDRFRLYLANITLKSTSQPGNVVTGIMSFCV